MSTRTGRQHGEGHRFAAPAQSLRCRFRAMARALRRWWTEERHYRPERRYMRG